jgi:hypothetical protein
MIMEVDPEVRSEQLIQESMFGVLDAVLVALVVGFGSWWLLKKRQQPEPAAAKSYSIQ